MILCNIFHDHVNITIPECKTDNMVAVMFVYCVYNVPTAMLHMYLDVMG